MATGRHIQKKGQSNATPTSATGMFKPHPFAMPAAPELQTKAEPGQVGGSRLSRIDVSAPPPIQPKLTIGAPDDKYEQEADTIARKVVQQISTPTPPGQNGSGDAVQRQLFSTPSIMRLTVQRREAVEGGAASSDLESTINQARSSGIPLGETIRRQMEGSFGADFSGVKVHTNNTADTLNRSLSARAFTTGNNIFFKQGEYNPSSSSGKELLAHELTHTIQQGSSPTVQRQSNSPLIKAAHQSLQTSTTLVQCKGMVISDKTRLHKVVGGKDKGTVGDNIAPGELIEISDNDSDHIKDVDGKIEWYRNAHGDGYIRSTKIFQGITVGDAENPENEDDLLGGFNDSAVSVSKDSLDDFSKEMEKKGSTTTDVDISSGSLGTAGGLLGMALSIKGLVGSKKEFGDWVDMIWNGIIVNSGKATAGISGIISSASESESTGAKNAKEVSGWSGSFASAFETLAGAVKTIKSVIDLIKMWSSDEKFGKTEYAKVGSDIISGALSTAKGVVDSIKSFIEIFNGPVGGLADAVPGLDIAINAVKMIIESYYLATSAYHWSKMRTVSLNLTQELETRGKGDKTKISAAKQQYATQRAEITNLETRKSAKEAKNQSRQQAINTLSTEQTELENKQQKLETERKQLEEDKFQLEQQNRVLTGTKNPQAAIQANQQTIQLKSTQINAKQKEIEGINEKLNCTLFRSGVRKEKGELQKKVNITTVKINEAATKITTKQGTMDAYATQTGLSQEDIEEVDLADELKSGNQKRIIRQSIHLSSDAVKIAGSIANLTGVGATAGVALKASAAGVDMSLPFFRALKQYGREKAAESQAKGETGTFSQWLFNANKSDIAKLKERKRHTATIFKMVNKLNDHVPLPGDKPEDKASKLKQFPVSSARVELFIQATGCEPKALYRLNGKPNEQASLILKSLYKREF
ncbi:DUF4157 domain-containing protein [Phormidium pseudopriestleyi FRX01]|uniref:DUF4157 domain-containing protein n=1 Tax=Phormidium pseudopriestleyi FRX01 TaxID=1759528 RepID=A0ABS3FPZ3_9CYAN|nr:DUF4157 domain-containing protein [Phormidium pseudopriestleyi]MBO0349044.1 DUF4157 domain-containing protein [Phormidium pseudopriestleyi FRX01]